MASSIIYQALSFVLVSLLLLPLARSATAPLRVCDVTAYGAVGDNATEATAAVQRAVADCAGGGTVLLPAPGIFLLRPVQLFSGVELRIEGTVAAWRNRTTWPNSTFQVCPCSPYETPDPVLAPQKESLFFAHNASDISITGSGVIDGQGWRWWFLRTVSEYWHNCRPKLVDMQNVTNFYMANITVQDSPFWTITGRGLRGALFEGVRVHTTACGYGSAPNTDGFNLAGEDMHLKGCRVRNGDDCVPIFPPSRNVTVEDLYCECGNGVVPVVWPYLSLPGQGGIVEDIVFRRVVLNGTATGVAIKSLPAFVGAARNILFEDITMHNVYQAVMFNVNNQNRAVAASGAAGAEARDAAQDATTDTDTGTDSRPSLGLASKHIGLGVVSIANVTVRNVIGYNTHLVGKVQCVPSAPCEGFVFDNVTMVGGTPGVYQCASAAGSATHCDPVPCGWGSS